MFQSDSPGLLIDKDNVFAVYLHEILVTDLGLEPQALRFNIDTHRLQYTKDGADYSFLLTRIDEDIEIIASKGETDKSDKWPLNDVVDDKMILVSREDLANRVRGLID